MSMWVLHQQLTADEQERIGERAHVSLPFGDVPDLSAVHSEVQCRHLLRALFPDEPPEGITRKVDRIWPYFSGVQPADMIVVPLRARGEVALAEVTGPYEYAVGEEGDDMHRVPVRWYDKRTAFRKMAKFKELLDDGAAPLQEITRLDARIFIREQLPHGYNRFVKLKWLMVVFFILGGIRFARQMMMGQ